MNSPTGAPWSSMVFEFGLDLAVKATAILAIVLVIQGLLGRRRAFLGSAVGNAGLIGLLILPVSALILPAVSIACLPSGTSDLRPDVSSGSNSRSARTWPRDLADDAMPITAARDHTTRTSPSEANLVRRADEAPRVVPASQTFAAAPSHASTRIGSIDWTAVAIAGYAIAALTLLARMGGSIRAVGRLRHSCVKVDDTQWIEALERWRRRLGIDREVVLTQSPCVSVPIVLGWLRPTIVLPDAMAGEHARGHADAVILHELSHVRRGDYPWNVLLRVVQALYWPHVLVWLLGRTLAAMRERACDDLCIHEMGGASAYRETLLAVASTRHRQPSPALGLAMARTSKLGRRLAQIERSHGDDRCVPRWPARITIVAMAVAVAGIIGTIQLVRSQAGATTPADPSKMSQAAAPAQLRENAGRVFHLQVVNAETNEAISDADVRVWMSLRDDWRKTDAQGRLDITHSTGLSDRDIGIDVWGNGRAMQRHNWGLDPNKPIPEGATIHLQPGETLGGLVQDEAGRPIAGATVYLWSHNYKKKDPHELLYDLRAVTGPDGRWQTSGAPETTGELLGFQIIHPDFLSSRDYSEKEIIPKIADLRMSKALSVMKKGVPIEGRVVDADGRPVAGARVLSTDNPNQLHTDVAKFAVTTDADGHFRTGQVKPGGWALIAQAKGHAPGVQSVTIGTAVPQVELALGRPHVFKGRVLDSGGNPIAGAFVNPGTWRGFRCLDAFFWTDADGRFRWDDAFIDQMSVNVSAQGYRGLFKEPVTASGEDLVFRLNPSLAIRGKLSDAETKKRVDNANVEYSAVDPNSGEPLKWTSLPELGFGVGVFQGALDVNFPITGDVYKIRVLSPGYHPFISRPFRREEKVVLDYDIALIPGTAEPVGSIATVLRPDGKPLAGARLIELQTGGQVVVLNGNANVAQGRKVREGRAGPDGRFAIPQYDKPWFVFILGDDSYASANPESLRKSPIIQARPYARVQGRYLIGSRPVPKRELTLNGMVRDPASFATIHLDQTATTDPQGRFSFKNVVPDTVLRVSRFDRTEGPGHVFSSGEPVRVEPGATAEVTLGGKGRPVIGRIEPPSEWAKPVDFTVESQATIQSNRNTIPYPLSLFRGKTSLGNEWNDWLSHWPASPEDREYASHHLLTNVGLAPDGSFRIDDVPPGEYRLAIRVNGKARYHVTASRRDPGPFGRIVRTFTVPPIPGGRTDEPMDLGVMRLRPRLSLKAGEPAPAFNVTTVEGKRLAVPADFRGKFLLLDFSTMWDTQSGIQITRLNDVNQRFGNDPRLAILSLTFAADSPEVRKYIAEKGESWPQAIVGPMENPISLAYQVDDEYVPATILIGPDGNAIASELWYDKIGKAVAAALGRADQ